MTYNRQNDILSPTCDNPQGRPRKEFDEQLWRELPKSMSLAKRAKALGLSPAALDRREILYAKEGKGLWITGKGWFDATPDQIKTYLWSRGEL